MKYANICIERGYAGADKRTGADAVRKINIGDYAQILAVDHLYHQMGIPAEEIVYIEYYDLQDYDGEYVVLPINLVFFNAHYGEKDLIFSPKITPVFLGIHAINGSYNERELEYFRRYAPIGCRDMRTLSIFRQKNIEAYMFGCSTLTLPKREEQKDSYQKIYFVDTPESLNAHIPVEIAEKAEYLSQEIYGDIAEWLQDENCETIKEYMKKRLAKYRDTAALIVTSRLHCAAPCIAMGIPTIFVCEEYIYTYAPLERYIPIYTQEHFGEIDWNPRPAQYEEMKQKIMSYAVKRIRDTYDKYHSQYEISAFYEQGVSKDFTDSYTWRIEKYAQAHWKPGKEISYMVWGVTQITEGVCEYLDQKYPNAKLVGVIDDYRELNYRGLDSMKSEKIPEYPNCYFIATGNSSSSAAQKKFAELGWVDKLCSVFGTNYQDSKKSAN